MKLLRVCLWVLAASAVTAPALARPSGNDRALAKQAYDRGIIAHKRGDMKTAAVEFARADSLAPSPVALQAALDAAVETDDAPLGAELLERSKREAPPAFLAQSIAVADKKFRGRAGRLRVHCPPDVTCKAKLDEKPVEVEKVVWAKTGAHSVVVLPTGADPQTKSVEVAADGVAEVTPSAVGNAPPTAPADPPPVAPAPPGDAPAADRSSFYHRRDPFTEGFPRIVFFGGVGLTVLLAGATTYFALDTSSTHGSFRDAGCERANFTPCAGLKDDGESSQTLANVALVGTLLVGLGTAALGIFLTDWKAPLMGLQPGPDGVRVAF